MTLLEVRDLRVRRGSRVVLDGVTLRVAPGEFVGLIGPNGAGKTTLLRAAQGLLAHEGHASLALLSAAARARAAAFLPQARTIAWPVPVAALVALGRVPHRSGPLRPADAAAVEAALAHMDLTGFRDRDVLALSGGEQARVLIARVLAQETPLILADEPVAGLDPAGQIRTMQVFAGLAAAGRGVLASVHDLGLAARHCTRLVLLSGGRILADGPPASVLSPENLAWAFGITAYHGSAAGGPVILPLDVIG